VFKQFDTIVAGRGTFEPMAAAGRTSMPGMKTIVVSKTLRSEDHPDVVIVPGIEALTDLKASPGKDIWLFGGGKLFRSLAEAGMVDTVEVSVMPILLGDGVPLAPNLSKWINLSLVNHKSIRRELFRSNTPFADKSRLTPQRLPTLAPRGCETAKRPM
jgi:dihydrofolate reductase